MKGVIHEKENLFNSFIVNRSVYVRILREKK